MWDSGAVLDALTSASTALVVKDLLFSWSSWGLAQVIGRNAKSWIPAFAERLFVGAFSLCLASEIYARLNYSQSGTTTFFSGSASIGSAIFIDQLASWSDLCKNEAQSLERKGERVTGTNVSWLSGLPAAAVVLAGVSYGVLSQIAPQISGNLASLVDWIFWPLGQPSLAWFVLIYCHLRLACQFLSLPSGISRLVNWAKTGNILFSNDS